MQNVLLQEVATLFHVPQESDRLYPGNDGRYKRYQRLLRRYDRTAWQPHVCWHCKDLIHAGDWYEACVYICKPAIFVERLGREVTCWVEKRHYPECPWFLNEMEAEMYSIWEFEAEQERQLTKRAA